MRRRRRNTRVGKCSSSNNSINSIPITVGIDPRSLERLVSFFYRGLLKVDSPSEAFSLIRAADMLLLQKTKEQLGR